jgi:serine phosphatase RsbU (regulator of sigma subunit)
MPLKPGKLGSTLRLAFVSIAVFSILAITLAALPILQDTIRDDRIKLFVEASTQRLASDVSRHLEQYQARVDALARSLALEGNSDTDIVRMLNAGAREPVSDLLPRNMFDVPWGVFDALAVIRADGTVEWMNTVGRRGEPLDTGAVRGRNVLEFPQEQETVDAALGGVAKHDWYRSNMVEAARREPPGGDISRLYHIAFAQEIPRTGRILLAIVSWEAIQQVLDNVEAPMAAVGFPSTYAFMFANDSDTVIAHHYRDPDPSEVNNYGTSLLKTHNLPDVAAAARDGKPSLRYEYPTGTPKVSGFARIADPYFGWTVGVGINDVDVVAPIRAVGWWLAAVALGMVLLSLAIAHYLSQHITRDLRELSGSASRLAQGHFGEKVDVRSRDEVGQLATAFNAMSATLAERDSMISRQQAELLERTRLEQELHLASAVQQRLLPQFRPELSTLDYVAVCQAAQGVSGDYYDFLPLGPGRLGLLVADVSGKGISAALLAASLQACVRTQAPLLLDRCGEVMTNVNTLLYAATSPERFATVFYAVYDDDSRTLHYVNAGHPPALLFRTPSLPGPAAALASANQQACVKLNSGVPPVGIFEALPTSEQSTQLAPGDWLVIYSDGLSEAENAQGEEFGLERIMQALRANVRAPSAEAMCQGILRSVLEYSRGRPQADDITLTVAHVR